MTEDAVRQLALVLGLLFAAGALLLLVLGALGRGRGLWTAYLVEPLIVGAVLVPAYLGPWPLALALLAIGLLATRELLRALGRAGASLNPRAVLALAAGLAAASWLAPQPLGAAGASLAMVAIAVPLLRGALPNGAGATLLAGVYPTLGLAQIALLGAGENGFGRVLFLYAIVEMNDAFALLGGRLLGRHRPWPTLSPNKTAEGAAVGLLASLGASVLFAFAVPELGVVQRLAIGLLVGLAVQAGDLVASAVKRRAGIKDYGAVVPGSGGVLDVYDSLAFAAPFYALLLS